MNSSHRQWRSKTAIFVLAFLMLAAVFVLAKNSYASASEGIGWGGQQAGFEQGVALSKTDPRIIIANIIRLALGFLGIIAVGLIMYAGFIYTTSGGEADKIAKAKMILKNVIIGLIIILSSFAIASFILSQLINSTTGGGPGGGGPGGWIGGYGAIGNCAIVNYYPTADQRDVPRNVSLMITFREDVDPATVFDQGTGLVSGNVKLFHKSEMTCFEDGGVCNSLVSDLRATTTDNRTFVFMPGQYLGSPTERIEYAIYLSSAVEKLDGGDSIFASCSQSSAWWSFQVSNLLDLDPPRVLENGVFPQPDNEMDDTINVSAAPAKVGVDFSAVPRAERTATVSGVDRQGGAWPEAASAIGQVCTDEALHVTVHPDTSSEVRIGGPSGALVGSGAVDSTGRIVRFDHCGLSLTMDSSDFVTACGGNCTWLVDVVPSVESSMIRVGDSVYKFVVAGTSPDEVEVGSAPTVAQVAAALALKINETNKQVGASNVTGTARVDLTALKYGSSGNRIEIASTDNAVFNIYRVATGTDSGISSERRGEVDQPKNSIIKVGFDDEIFPISISGSAENLAGNIFVECFDGSGCENLDAAYYFACDADRDGSADDKCLRGDFIVSNQYRTVEFRSNNRCGTNACGEDIFCLPGNSRIRVGLVAADLAGCDNCAARTPYTACNAHCQDADGNNYPMAAGMTGIMDKARNSLDGNRNSRVVGPDSFFNENIPDQTLGDSYEWSFYIVDRMDLTAPQIGSVDPANATEIAATSDPIAVSFDKIMMNSSLLPGQVKIRNSQGDQITHKRFNLWSAATFPVGYWITAVDNTTADGTNVAIRHTQMADATDYHVQVGSGVKDIYQNCYKPSGGAGCAANDTDPSCCYGTPSSALNSEGNCN